MGAAGVSHLGRIRTCRHVRHERGAVGVGETALEPHAEPLLAIHSSKWSGTVSDLATSMRAPVSEISDSSLLWWASADRAIQAV